MSNDPFQSGIIFSYGIGGYGFALWDDGRLFLTKNGSSAVFSSLSVTDTAFHHVAVTKTGSTVVFYVDGMPNAVGPYDPGFGFSDSVAIGGRGGDLAASFLGTIDEVSIYNRALSESEVQAIYNGGVKCAFSPFIVSHPQDLLVA